jgi:hypothetical protein
MGEKFDDAFKPEFATSWVINERNAFKSEFTSSWKINERNVQGLFNLLSRQDKGIFNLMNSQKKVWKEKNTGNDKLGQFTYVIEEVRTKITGPVIGTTEKKRKAKMGWYSRSF